MSILADEKKSDADMPVAARLTRHIRRNLMSGLLLLIPLGITIFVLQFLYRFLAVFLSPVVRFAPEGQKGLVYFLALIVLIVLVYIAGIVTRHVLGQQLFAYVESLVLRIPLVKSVYSASKQVVTSVSTTGQSAFKSVVMVEFFSPSLKVIGFVAGVVKDTSGGILYKVFIPTTPNPTSGFLVFVPREKIHELNIAVEDALKVVISGGVISPAEMDVGVPHSPQEGGAS